MRQLGEVTSPFVEASKFRLPTGAAVDKIITSDADGNFSWQDAPPGMSIGGTITGGPTDNYNLYVGTGGVLAQEAQVAVTRGGTGFGSYTAFNMLYANTTTSLAKLAPNTTTQARYLRMQGTGTGGAVPTWSPLNLSEGVGLVGPPFGGTGITTYTHGDLLWANTSSSLSQLAIGAAGSFLRSVQNVDRDPEWTTDFFWTGTLLKLGGTSASFPALKRNGTALQVVLADDSDGSSLIVGKGSATVSQVGQLIVDGGASAQGKVDIVGLGGALRVGQGATLASGYMSIEQQNNQLGITRSGSAYLFWYDTSTGDVYMNNTFGGSSKLYLAYEGTPVVTVTSAGASVGGALASSTVFTAWGQISSSGASGGYLVNRRSDGTHTGTIYSASGDFTFYMNGLGDAFSVDPDGKFIQHGALLNNATGDEVAFTLNYTTNKATSGNDYGLRILQTDTASPGTSYTFASGTVGSPDSFYVTNTGAVGALSVNAVALSTNTAVYFGNSDTAIDRSGVGTLRTQNGSGTTYFTFDGPNMELEFGTRSILHSPADGNFTLLNAAGNSFGVLQFGGTSSSYPGLKRSGANLQVRLANDGGFGNLIVNALFDGDNHIAFNYDTTGQLKMRSAGVIDWTSGSDITAGIDTKIVRGSAGVVAVLGASSVRGQIDTNFKTTAGITASTTQTQGQGALTSDINEIATCANANDTVTLPAATAGRECTIINNGAQTAQVFPASGDNLGAGVDASTTIAAGAFKRFIAYDTTNWEDVS